MSTSNTSATTAEISSTASSVKTFQTLLWDEDEDGVRSFCHNTMSSSSSGNKSSSNEVPETGQLLENIITTMNALMEANPVKSAEEEVSSDSATIKKRRTGKKRNRDSNEKSKEIADVFDTFQIWTGLTDEVPAKMGSVLTQITIAGMVNAMSGQEGGVVDSKMIPRQQGLSLDDGIASAAGIAFRSLKQQAQVLHRAVQTRVEADFLATTPSRIQQMLCPELEPQEFKAIRKRIYETIYEGKGRRQMNGNGAEEGADLPVASRGVIHDIEKDKKCPNCGNNDQSLFVMDRKNGDIICQNCGTVVSESLMHEGSQFRKFEGEVDRNHHGDAPNALYSNAHNMATTLGGLQVLGSAGGGGFGTHRGGLENVLRNAHSFTELNISNFGKGERKTRIGYKDRQKKDAFVQMNHAGDALHLHEAVVRRGKELFAGFRDDRELVQQFKGVIAACLCEAFDQFSKDGLQLMKQRQAQESETLMNTRATKRNALHNASMAGKGGLLLDFRKVESEKETAAVSGLEKKPAASWDLDDCRSWLLEGSRSIAQQWKEARKSPDAPKNIPSGTQEELEGKLVEHTIALCDMLERELKSRDNRRERSDSGRTTLQTPRVQMGHLGIKWQHAHERGSGGKGGVGGSGRSVMGGKPGEKSGRTAGQLLILKTAKKLGVMLKDPVAGDALHRELRALVGRQDARKRKDMREEATRQRFQQMKRKPWLQAKAEEESS